MMEYSILLKNVRIYSWLITAFCKTWEAFLVSFNSELEEPSFELLVVEKWVNYFLHLSFYDLRSW
ncbi:MAG: hypothetical protein CMP48_16100 [Rickettsiales bacterium]|nr:hypothetical protein [Rickettsiales bacterium]